MEFLLRLLLVPVWAVAFVRVRATQEATLLSTLAVGVEKQLPLVAVLEALAGDASGSWRWKVRGLSELLAADMSLPEAINSVPELLSADTLAMIRVGASTGNLSGAFREAAALARRRSDAQIVNVHGALFYASILMFALMMVGGFIMYYIIPKYKAIFEGFEAKLPPLTELVISAGNAGQSYWYLLVLAIPLALLGLWLGTGFGLDLLGLGPAWGRQPFGLSIRFLPRLKTPPLLRCLALCIEGGRPLTHALGALTENHPDMAFRQHLLRILDGVSRGDECWLSLRACGMLRRGEPALLDAAQRVGNLPWALRGIAENIERRAMYRFHILAQFIDPALTLAAGTVIGLFCVSLFLPLIELLHKLS